MPTDTLTAVSPEQAMTNLADLHGLAPWLKLRCGRENGRTVIRLAVPKEAADKWRSAVAAPPFHGEIRDGYIVRVTHCLWMGAEVQLTTFGEYIS